MGMYDTIQDELFCPFCGNLSESQDFQTKDLTNMLINWKIKELVNTFNKPEHPKEINIYHRCKNCLKWIEIKLDLEREKIDGKVTI